MNEIHLVDCTPLSAFLQKHFPIVNIPLKEEEKADFILSDTFTPHIEYFKGIRILYTGENHPVDLNRFDYCLTHDMRETDRCHRFPYWQFHCLIHHPQYQQPLLEPRKTITAEELIAQQRDFCAFVCRNPKGKERNSLVRKLNEQRKVSCGGPFMNNMGYIVPKGYDAKQEFLGKHFFTIAYENEAAPGYQTEKIVDAFLANSIPIYWGSKHVAEEFNPKAFVNANDFRSEKALIGHIMDLLNSPEAMADMLSQPILQDTDVFKKAEQGLIDFFARIFERGPGALQRTPMQRFLGVASRYYGHGLFRTIRYTIRRMKGEYK